MAVMLSTIRGAAARYLEGHKMISVMLRPQPKHPYSGRGTTDASLRLSMTEVMSL